MLVMDQRAVRYFVSVVETGSFSGAAHRLGLSQPSISEKVKMLERNLGYALLDRSHRQIKLTEEGEAFLEIARTYLLESQRLLASARQIGAQRQDRITIGCSHSATSAPERDLLVDAFMQAEPNVSVRIVSMEQKSLLEAYWRAEIDLVITVGPLPEELAAARRLLLCEQFATLFVPEEHPLAGMETIALENLGGVDIAVFPAVSHPELCLYIYRVLREHRASLLEVPEASFITLQNFARRRRICALSVDSMAPFAGESLIARPLADAPFGAPLYLLEPRLDAPAAAKRMWRFACARHVATGPEAAGAASG